MFFVSDAFAQAAGGAQGGAFSGLIPILLIFFVFYFLLIRPQQKKQKEHQNMVAALKRGDKIVTAGGIVAVVTKVIENENIAEVEIADGVKVKINRSTVAEFLSSGADKPEKAAPKKKPAAKSKKKSKA